MKPTAEACRWCGEPIPAERRRRLRTRYCCDDHQLEDTYEDAEAQAIREAQERGPKVLGMEAAHPATPRGVRLVGVEGEVAVLGCKDGRRLRRPLAEVYDPTVARRRAGTLFVEWTEVRF